MTIPASSTPIRIRTPFADPEPVQGQAGQAPKDFAHMSVAALTAWCYDIKLRLDLATTDTTPTPTQVEAVSCLLAELREFFGELTDDLVAISQHHQLMASASASALAVDEQPTAHTQPAVAAPAPASHVHVHVVVPFPDPQEQSNFYARGQ